MEWNKEKTLILIKEFHQRPGLWNMTHEDYRKKETKRRLLEEIAAKFDNYISAADIERKFHTLRTQYHREINRMNVIRGTEPYKSKWFAFQHLQFLNDPSACRNSQNARRRTSVTPAKIVYLSNLNVKPSNLKAESVATSTATIHSVQVTVADKNTHTPENNTMDLRKDLRVLFEEAVDSEEDKNEELHVSNSAVPEGEEYVHEEIQCKVSTNTSSNYEEEHLVEEQPQQQNQPDTEVDIVEEHESYHHQIDQSPPIKMIKTDHHNANVSTTRRTHDIYQDINYETSTLASTQHLYGTKHVYKDAETHTAQPILMARDEFSTFGECVANELRFITDRQILVSVKHKINTALFEASLQQLQKNSNG